MDIKIANEQSFIDVAFERTIKDICITPRPVIRVHVQDEIRKETPSFNRPGQIIAAYVSLPVIARNVFVAANLTLAFLH
jgi:hypothetical protein